MKLLIVDDEALTREGLIASIPWESLGISRVLQADDGVNGLKTALQERPQLILCDVRMPRMDGIHMVEQLQEQLPDTVVIFMSGYSDKEYLKAAIKLNAVSYVEKPLNPEEISEAILEGAARYQKKQKSLRGETFVQLETSARLAMQLTFPYAKQAEAIQQLLLSLSLTGIRNSHFTTYIVRILKNELPDTEQKRAIFQSFVRFLEVRHLSALHVEKHQIYFIFHIYGAARPLSDERKAISSFLRESVSCFGSCFISHGETVHGISNVYRSFETAVLLMQSCYFFDRNEVLTPEILSTVIIRPDIRDFLSTDYTSVLSDAMLAGQKDSCMTVADSLYRFFYQNTQVLFDQARDLYYKLFNAIHDVRRRMQLPDEYQHDSGHMTIISYVEQFYTFLELHQALEQKISAYFEENAQEREENSTVFLIKDYISRHYQSENLSVKEISEHVYLSASYVCTLFKSETNQTLNQYITEYRIEKAKKLMQDPRNKISDISSKVGYSDGNYFGKSFKKMVGLSPSEYRDKVMK